MLWNPTRMWEGLDAFIIGGGNSLRHGFDFNVLVNEKTIGCNNAYRYGPAICNICVFGDTKWFLKHRVDLAKFAHSGGMVVTNQSACVRYKDSWLLYVKRRSRGLHIDALGWNTNTGSPAINLALILGAKNVYLLGFDRKLSEEGRPNWHDDLIDKPDGQNYVRMNNCDKSMQKDLAVKFPGQSIINVNDDSNLTLWPTIPLAEFFSERISHVTMAV
jgi:hypothetical protein